MIKTDNEQYKNLLQTAPFGYAYHRIILDSSGKPYDYEFLEMNAVFERLTSLKGCDILNHTLREVLPEVAARVADRIAFFGDVALHGGQKEFDHYSNSLKRWYKAQVSSSEKYFFSITISDITEHKLTEEASRQYEKALQESENRFRRISAMTSDIAYSCRTNQEGDFSIEWMTGAATRITGYSIEEIIQQGCWCFLVLEEDIPIFKNNVIGLAAGSQGSCELRIRKKNGEVVWISSFAECVAESHTTGSLRLYGGLTDITQRKHKEEALRIEHERLTGIIRGTNVGTWEWNIQTGETVFNERWAEIIGYTLQELSPVSIETWKKFTHPDDLPLSNELLIKHFRGELEYYEFESRMRHKDGSWTWVLDRGKVAEWTKDGKPLLMQGTHQDITKRKRVEEQLLDANQKLKEATVRAESASIAKSNFLANMSHELRTPLNGILGFAQLLLDTPMSQIQKEYLQYIFTSSDLLKDVVGKILDFSKIEAGKLQLNEEESDLQKLCQQVFQMVHFQAQEKGIELRLEFDNKIPKIVMLDLLRFQQILLNLVGNAVKFTHTGSVVLKVQSARIEPDGKRGRIHFEVRDTGIGISEEFRQKIFGKFEQQDASTTRKYGGTGLGLSITVGLLELMGSSLKLESKPGVGSVFSFDLDVRWKVAKSPQKVGFEVVPIPTGSDGEQAYKVLLVEDDIVNMMLAKKLMTRYIQGVIVRQAEDGEEAVEAFCNYKPDMIFMDVQMPRMDGYAATRENRKIEAVEGGHVPIIGLTAAADQISREGCYKSGMDDYISKPFAVAELKATILKWVGGRK